MSFLPHEMSDAVYSEINFHITWHTKSSLPMITDRIERRLYQYLTHKILETPGARLHAIGGIETHIHIATSLQPNILVSDWIGKLTGASSYYVNHKVQPKALEWQRGLQWVIDYVNNQKEHHNKGTVRERLERIGDPRGAEGR
jgi:putative transposase